MTYGLVCEAGGLTQFLWRGYFFLFAGLLGDDSETVHAFKGAVEALGLRALVDEEEERTGVFIFPPFFFLCFLPLSLLLFSLWTTHGGTHVHKAQAYTLVQRVPSLSLSSFLNLSLSRSLSRSLALSLFLSLSFSLYEGKKKRTT